MSREHNGIHNPNKQVSPGREFHDGKKALVAAGVGITLFGVNFGLPMALNKAADSVYAKGEFTGGMYFPNANPDSDPAFICNSDGNVIKSERELYENELGEVFNGDFDKDNYGPQDGACEDGQLTPRDGEFWNSKISEWGLAGLIFK